MLAAVLRQYAERGRPPSLQEISASLDISQQAVSESLLRLHRHDLILLDPNNRLILGAYPFTEKATGHSITIQRTGRTLSTMCAVDALGAGAMCRENVTIHSNCRLCGKPIAGQVEQQGMTLAKIEPARAVVWIGLEVSSGCAAESLCTEMLFFCGDAHLNQWRSARGIDGYDLSPEEAFEVGKALFIDRALMGDTPRL